MRKQAFNRFRPATIAEVGRVEIIVPAFLLSPPTWAGASSVLLEFPVNNDYYFSILTPIRSTGYYFILAIRWVEDGIIKRFKLWDNTLGILYYPIYDGERIGPNAVFEVWSINSASAPELDDNTSLWSSQLIFPEASCQCACVSNPNELLLAPSSVSPLPPYAFCNPFCMTFC